MSILDLVFPQKCRACGAKLRKRDLALCASCRSEYENAKHRICQKCKHKYVECTCRADVGDGYVREYYTLFKYKKDTPGGSLILSIKDRKDAQALKLLSVDMERVLRRRLPAGPETLLTYVPRKPESLRDKGVDQAKELTKRISELSDIPYMKLLKSRKSRVDQKSLSASERAEHVQGLYRFTGKKAQIRSKRVVLVDDVCTTGATTAACAQALCENGAAEVYVLTAGR